MSSLQLYMLAVKVVTAKKIVPKSECCGTLGTDTNALETDVLVQREMEFLLWAVSE
jgi:hypothetical protein